MKTPPGRRKINVVEKHNLCKCLNIKCRSDNKFQPGTLDFIPNCQTKNPFQIKLKGIFLCFKLYFYFATIISAAVTSATGSLKARPFPRSIKIGAATNIEE